MIFWVKRVALRCMEETHKMYFWIIGVGVFIASWMYGGSFREIFYNAFAGIIGFAFLAIIVGQFFPDDTK